MRLDLESVPVGEDAPEMVNAVVEVPVGSRNKYEYQPEFGLISATGSCRAASATRWITTLSPPP